MYSQSLLEGFLEEISPDGLQVVAEEIGEPEQRLFIEILTAPEQRQAGLLQDGGPATALGMNSKRCSAS